ncbi:MAG: hypothetical protein O3C63_07490 [Cyanobacteria bacterium]|nr:hypothetical protein [Cyanobacteriota bacterium]MDA1021471.1 hypothetical protein [Cyanobacteriota bacterium]
MAESSTTKNNLLQQLADANSDFTNKIQEQYSDTSILEYKKQRIKELLQEPILLANKACTISRCPGRISLSKHADYINNDLLYVLDDRDIYIAAQTNDANKLILINQNSQFENVELEQSQIAQVEKSKWYFYACQLYTQFVKDKQGITLVYNSDLPEAAGLSSSHALMISTAMALVSLDPNSEWQASLKTIETRIENKDKIHDLLKLFQDIEHSRGFKSGLGDQSAQIFGKKDHFSFIKLEPNLEIIYQVIPKDLGIMTVTSSIKADKNLKEFQAANENIAAYKSINKIAEKYNCKFLGDLLYQYNEPVIFKILEDIEDPKLRGLALYGLAEGARVKELKDQLDASKLGAHLNLSHRAESNFKQEQGQWLACSPKEQETYKFNTEESLASHSGIYHASTLINDQLQDFSNSLDGVFGSSISGAGLGGSNSIICQRTQLNQIEQALIGGFHIHQKIYIHASSSSSAANTLR